MNTQTDVYKFDIGANGALTTIYRNGEVMQNVKSFMIEGSAMEPTTLTFELDVWPEQVEVMLAGVRPEILVNQD